MSTILAIDPGNIESGWAAIDSTSRRPLAFNKTPNDELLEQLVYTPVDAVAIEMVASYGMPVGAEVFETCVWVGRFQQRLADARSGVPVELVKRQPVKLHHCQSSRAKDSNVIQALVDRFTPGASNFGKGTKAAPGWFHGFRKDVWQAYALAVYVADVS